MHCIACVSGAILGVSVLGKHVQLLYLYKDRYTRYNLGYIGFPHFLLPRASELHSCGFTIDHQHNVIQYTIVYPYCELLVCIQYTHGNNVLGLIYKSLVSTLAQMASLGVIHTCVYVMCDECMCVRVCVCVCVSVCECV